MPPLTHAEGSAALGQRRHSRSCSRPGPARPSHSREGQAAHAAAPRARGERQPARRCSWGTPLPPVADPLPRLRPQGTPPKRRRDPPVAAATPPAAACRPGRQRAPSGLPEGSPRPAAARPANLQVQLLQKAGEEPRKPARVHGVQQRHGPADAARKERSRSGGPRPCRAEAEAQAEAEACPRPALPRGERRQGRERRCRRSDRYLSLSGTTDAAMTAAAATPPTPPPRRQPSGPQRPRSAPPRRGPAGPLSLRAPSPHARSRLTAGRTCGGLRGLGGAARSKLAAPPSRVGSTPRPLGRPSLKSWGLKVLRTYCAQQKAPGSGISPSAACRQCPCPSRAAEAWVVRGPSAPPGPTEPPCSRVGAPSQLRAAGPRRSCWRAANRRHGGQARGLTAERSGGGGADGGWLPVRLPQITCSPGGSPKLSPCGCYLERT